MMMGARLSSVLLLFLFVPTRVQADTLPKAKTVKPFRYIVKTGDTPSGLAAKWGIPASMIASEGETLHAGAVVTIPLRERRKILRGDALWDLSKHYGIPVETLAKFNSLPPPYILKRGRTLMVPDFGPQPKTRKK